jgi:nicotinate-nucleotide--dimethylbenzimidazole phosphoribosyltransferase
MLFQTLISQIQPVDKTAAYAAQVRQSQLTKPAKSLGRLEDLSIQLAGISRNPYPKIRDKLVLLMAGDHGVVREGVSAYPQSVTAQMVSNILCGGAAISVLSRHLGTKLIVVDMGVVVDLPPHPDLEIAKIGYGTGNIARERAMSLSQAAACLDAGAKICQAQIELGMDILATGEMGIGNTTPSAAIASAITGLPPEQIAGRGTGINQQEMECKIETIYRALQLHHIDPTDGLDVLSKLGGFEIGGLAGAILAAAANRRPVVLDGFISTAAAMIACLLAPDIRQYLIPGHLSLEGGHSKMLEWLGLKPLLNLDLCLGEGSGAVLAFPIIEAACNLLSEMATFKQANVSEKED